MANSFDILVKGDFKQVAKGFTDLSKKFEEISKKSISFKLDKESAAFFKDGGSQILKKLQGNLAEARLGMKEMAKTAGNSAFDFKNFEEAADRVSYFTDQINNVQKSLGKLEQGRGGRIMSSLFEKMGGGGGGGSALDFTGGDLLSEAVKWGAKKIAAASIDEVYKGLGKFDEQSGDRMKLMSFGIDKYKQDASIQIGRNALYTPGETLKQMSALAQLTGSTDMLPDIQKYSRSFGIDPGQLIGQAGELKQMGFGGKEMQRQFATLLGEAVASKIERSRIGEFLEQVASYTGSLSQNQSVDPAMIAQTVREVMDMSKGGFFGQPGGAISGMNAVDTYIKNAAKGGMGLGTVSSMFSQLYPSASGNELVLKMKQGLYGPSESQLDEDVKAGRLSNEEASLFKGASPLALMKSAFQMFDKNAKNIGPADRLNYISNELGGMDPYRVGLIDQLLKSGKSQNIQEQELQKILQDATNDPLTAIKASTEGIHADTAIIREIMLTNFGQAFAPLRNKLQQMANSTEGVVYGQELEKYLQYGNSKHAGGTGVPIVEDSGGDQYSIKTKNKSRGWWDVGGLTTLNNSIVSSGSGNLSFKTDEIRKRFFSHTRPDLLNAAINYPGNLTMTDSWRTAAENARTKGSARNSKHMSGGALDFSVKNLSIDERQQALDYFRGQGYKAFLHKEGVNEVHLHVEVLKELNTSIKTLNNTVHENNNVSKQKVKDFAKSFYHGIHNIGTRLIGSGDEK